MQHPVITSIFLGVVLVSVSVALAKMFRNMLYVEQLKKVEFARRKRAEKHMMERAGIDIPDNEVSN